MSKRCIIISGGEYAPVEGLREDDFVIACDRGYLYAKGQGIQPDLLVSDYDSYDGPVDRAVAVERFRPEKDDTDTMIAIRYAVEHGFEELVLFSALGGRLDHLLGNLQAIVYAQAQGLRAAVFSPDTRVYTLCRGSLRLPKREGWSLSVLAAEDRCEGISIRGAKYPLTDATLTNRFPLGISNEWAADEAEVTVREGILLVVLSKLK